MSGLRSPIFFIILAIYVLAGTLFATLTPNWQAPDEPAHYNYIRYLAAQSGFPELVSSCYNQAYLQQLTTRRFSPELPVDNICYEFHQPPLYYLLATPLFILTGGSLTALRLFSVILGAGVVTLAFLIGRVIFPNQPVIAYGTMALVAFVPMHAAMLGSVNNDALAELILAALLLLLTRRIMADFQPSTRRDVVLGLILGLGLVTKTTVYIAVPLILAGLWLTTVSWPTKRINWFNLLKRAALIYGVAGLVALPWYIRNINLYGNWDILGLTRHNQVVVGQLRTTEFLAQVGWLGYLNQFFTTTFRSFWGQFGWMAVPMSDRVYLVLLLLLMLALLGWVKMGLLDRDILRFEARPDQALALMALTVILMVLGYAWYNLEFTQFQGRYLFPALIPLAIFLTLGWQSAFSWPMRWWLVASLGLALGGQLLAGALNQDLDKTATLLIGVLLVLLLGRIWLAQWYGQAPVPWLLGLVYGGLALLTLVSPFWYIIPYLSP